MSLISLFSLRTEKVFLWAETMMLQDNAKNDNILMTKPNINLCDTCLCGAALHVKITSGILSNFSRTVPFPISLWSYPPEDCDHEGLHPLTSRHPLSHNAHGNHLSYILSKSKTSYFQLVDSFYKYILCGWVAACL